MRLFWILWRSVYKLCIFLHPKEWNLIYVYSELHAGGGGWGVYSIDDENYEVRIPSQVDSS